jgi:hypothetical protein
VNRQQLLSQQFPLGQLVATPGVLQALQEASEHPASFLARHAAGDWGDLSDADKAENDASVAHGLRIFSAYHLSTGVKIWLITEADRSVTTVLLPSEY